MQTYKKRASVMKVYRDKNPDKVRAWNKESRLKAKYTHKAWFTNVYGRMKSSSKSRENCPLLFSKLEFIDWIYSLNGHFEKLHQEWVKSGFKKDLVPSVDRKDDYKGYSFDNIKLTTWEINNKNQCSKMATEKWSKEVEQLDIDDNLLNTFSSTREAATIIGKPKSSSFISAACRGEYPTAFGFKWRYTND